MKEYIRKYKERVECYSEALNDVVPDFSWLFIKSWFQWQLKKISLLWEKDEDV